MPSNPKPINWPQEVLNTADEWIERGAPAGVVLEASIDAHLDPIALIREIAERRGVDFSGNPFGDVYACVKGGTHSLIHPDDK